MKKLRQSKITIHFGSGYEQRIILHHIFHRIKFVES